MRGTGQYGAMAYAGCNRIMPHAQKACASLFKRHIIATLPAATWKECREPAAGNSPCRQFHNHRLFKLPGDNRTGLASERVAGKCIRSIIHVIDFKSHQWLLRITGVGVTRSCACKEIRRNSPAGLALRVSPSLRSAMAWNRPCLRHSDMLYKAENRLVFRGLLVRLAGVEPATYRLGGGRSIH